jgi:tetratricopeptide (TPR) repeat protein
MARGYHRLGILAQDRGDYDAAEPLYRRSLEINERIGDPAGVATSYAVLGGLSEAAGNLDEAVAYRVGALAIRLEIGTATGGDVQPLAGLRRRLGRTVSGPRSWRPGWGRNRPPALWRCSPSSRRERPPGTDPAVTSRERQATCTGHQA